ncbi:hypothetical protein HOLleu_43400 [Holothuria leucospilota]|uniref:Uncharacterized protein n=1 Tax=Holothuria leucospilota TaxID=206669 RepID=A0A9Q1B919_HOLLE|nr:hypothetical protein HOLleu_43400 [Holothuria leucospilota]
MSASAFCVLHGFGRFVYIFFIFCHNLYCYLRQLCSRNLSPYFSITCMLKKYTVPLHRIKRGAKRLIAICSSTCTVEQFSQLSCAFVLHMQIVKKKKTLFGVKKA